MGKTDGRMDGRSDRHEEANSCLSRFCLRAGECEVGDACNDTRYIAVFVAIGHMVQQLKGRTHTHAHQHTHSTMIS